MSLHRCITGYRRHTAKGGGGEPCVGLASRTGGSSNTLGFASCYRNVARVPLYVLPTCMKVPISGIKSAVRILDTFERTSSTELR